MNMQSRFHLGRVYKNKSGLAEFEVIAIRENTPNKYGIVTQCVAAESGITFKLNHIYVFSEDCHSGHCDPQWNLVGEKTLSDYRVNDPVMVRDSDREDWVPRHFAGVEGNATLQAFAQGFTSFTVESNKEITRWAQYREPTKEELNRIKL